MGYKMEDNKKNNANGDNEISDIESLLKQMGAELKPKKKQEKPLVQQVREAFIRYEAKKLQKNYEAALDRMGDELQYASARYFVAGIVGLLPDAMHSLWDTIKNICNSPLAKEEIEGKFGKGATLSNILIRARRDENGEIKEASNEVVETVRSFSKFVDRTEKHVEIVADYCRETGKSPDEILASPKDSFVVIEKVYGSIEEYEKKQIAGIQSIKSLTDYLKKLENMPFNLMFPIYMKAKFEDGEDAKRFGVDFSAVGKILDSYVGDLVKFADAILTEEAKAIKRRIDEYKALAQQD